MKPLEINRIKELIAAFYNGETTVEEEQLLLQYFNSKDVAEELKDEQKLFLQFYDSADVEMPHSLENKLSMLIDEWAEKDTGKQKPQSRKKPLWIWVSSAAAGMAILLTIGWFLHTPPTTMPQVLSEEQQLKDTYTDPQQAYAEAEKALAMVSKNFNKGMNQLYKVNSEIESTNQKVKKIINHNQKHQN